MLHAGVCRRGAKLSGFQSALATGGRCSPGEAGVRRCAPTVHARSGRNLWRRRSGASPQYRVDARDAGALGCWGPAVRVRREPWSSERRSTGCSGDGSPRPASNRRCRACAQGSRKPGRQSSRHLYASGARLQRVRSASGSGARAPPGIGSRPGQPGHALCARAASRPARPGGRRDAGVSRFPAGAESTEKRKWLADQSHAIRASRLTETGRRRCPDLSAGAIRRWLCGAADRRLLGCRDPVQRCLRQRPDRCRRCCGSRAGGSSCSNDSRGTSGLSDPRITQRGDGRSRTCRDIPPARSRLLARRTAGKEHRAVALGDSSRAAG